MSRTMVGLLAAVGAIMSALVGLTHGDVVGALICLAGLATGSAAYLALSSEKKCPRSIDICVRLLLAPDRELCHPT
jgi:hypothetical protein